MALRPKGGLIGNMDDDDDEYAYKEREKPVPVAREQRGGRDALGLDSLLFGPTPVKKPVQPAVKPVVPPSPQPTPQPNINVTPTPAPSPPKPTPHINKPVPPPQIIPPPKPDVQTYRPPSSISTYETLVKVKPGSFNRPAYIRKFKKIAENYNYRERNEKSVEVQNVLRLAECYYSEVKKLSRSGFVDSEFPANYTAFVDNVKERKIGHYNDWNNWKTPREVFRAPVLGKYVDPNDIERGLFTSDFLVSCLASLAERENNIKRLVEEQVYTETGFYYVRLNINGVWRYIAVDHSIPVHKDGSIIAAHSYADDESELWPTLIEKAYTKAYGTYEQYSRIQSREAYLRDLTGAPVRLYTASDPNLLKNIQSALDNGYVVQAAPSEKLLTYGFNPNLTLSVIKADSSKRSLQFRSSFGSVDEKPRFNLSKEGTFDVSVDETRNFINYFLVAEVHDDYSTSTIQARHRPGYFSSYSFRVSKDFNGYVMASQFDRRHFNQPSNLYAEEAKVKVQNYNHYENSPLGLFIYKKEGDTATQVASGSARSKNLDLQVSLTPGEYVVFLTVNWVEKDYDFNISVYGSELVTFKRIHNKNNPNGIANGIDAQAIRDGPK